MKNIKKIWVIIILSLCILLPGCQKGMDQNRAIGAEEKRRKNIDEGRGASIGNILGKVGSTNYEFSTSNPMWRASLETLDFLPLTTVDYSGGIIITDWYSENSNSTESIKISIRFLTNEIRSDALDIKVFSRKCTDVFQNCTIEQIDGSIVPELKKKILKTAALYKNKSEEESKQ